MLNVSTELALFRLESWFFVSLAAFSSGIRLMSVNESAAFERLLRLPLPALRSVTDCLSGHCIARLWFAGDRALQLQLSRGGVTHFEVEINNWKGRQFLQLGFLASLTSLETLIIKPVSCPTQNLEVSDLVIDTKVLPASLRIIKFGLATSPRTLATTLTGPLKNIDLSKLFPHLQELDLSESKMCLYDEVIRSLPRWLKVLRFAHNSRRIASPTAIDQGMLDLMPQALQELHFYTSEPHASRSTAAQKLNLQRFTEMTKLHWLHNAEVIGSLPSATLKHLAISTQFDNIFITSSTYIQQCGALESLEINANCQSGFGAKQLIKTETFFETLPRGLKSFTLNYVQFGADDNLTVDDFQLALLPSGLETLILAGFVLPIAGLKALPCKNLKHLAIFHVGEPLAYNIEKTLKVGARFYAGHRRVKELFFQPGDLRYRFSLPRSYLYDQIPGCTESDDAIFREPDTETITADLVSCLPRSLTKLILPHISLADLDIAAGAVEWPPKLNELFIGEVPLSHIPLLPQSLSSLDIIFTPSAEHIAAQASSNQALPPLLHRLRCSVPTVGNLGAEITFPRGLEILDLAIEDEKKPQSRRTWSRVLPPKLRSLSVLALSSMFSQAWMTDLPVDTLRELEMDVHCLGTKKQQTPPIDNWTTLPPNLLRFVFRINMDLPFDVLSDLPSRLETLVVETTSSEKEPQIPACTRNFPLKRASLPSRLRNVLLPQNYKDTSKPAKRK